MNGDDNSWAENWGLVPLRLAVGLVFVPLASCSCQSDVIGLD
jgi:hypothetical protein